MSNLVLAKLVFFMTFYASAGEVSCEGVIHTGPGQVKLSMLRGTRIGKIRAFRNSEIIRVDVSQNFNTPYELKNNDKYQDFNRNSCMGDI